MRTETAAGAARWAPRVVWVALWLGLSTLVTGCSTTLGFYAQAAKGGVALQLKAKPIDRWLSSNRVTPELRSQLELVEGMRLFAANELGLEVGKSYRQYADLGRSAVVWNVTAARAVALEPVQWCYPIAGCVTYRGYFKKKAAERYARRLAGRGFDVSVSGATAYSTLGRLNDPVLNTFVYRGPAELAGTLFHELAHATYYVAGDTRFNESLASAIERAGVARWLEQQGRPELLAPYLAEEATNREFTSRLLQLRSRLEQCFEGDAAHARKLSCKALSYEEFARDTKQLAAESPEFSGWARWVAAGLNNANLAAVAVYWDWEPVLSQQLAERGWDDFDRWIRQLVTLSKSERAETLEALERDADAS